VAGAGSGKTAVLTRRVALLLLAGCPADQIFVATFTVKAAGEMKERIGKQVQDLAGRVPPAIRARLDDLMRALPKAWIGTFHSLCLRMLREKDADGFSAVEELGYPPTFSILSDADSRKLLKESCADLAVPCDPRDLSAALDLAVNELLTPETLARHKTYEGVPGEAAAEAWKKYVETKRSRGLADFGDLLYLAATAIADRRMCAERWKTRFSHVLIDEYQDTNVAQYAIATELAAARRNLFVVGDDDQSIYGFRGADIRNIRAFTEDYPDARIVRLIRNYRSTPVILGAANAVLADRPAGATDKTLLAMAPAGARPPEKIVVYEASDEQDEMNFVAFQIQEFLQEGFRHEDMVIFYRVHELSGPVASALRARQVPYVEVGGPALLENDVVRTFRAVYQAVNVAALKREGRLDPIRDSLLLQEALREIWTLGILGPKNRVDHAMLLALPAPERILLDEQGYVEAVRACQSGEAQQHLERMWTGIHGAAFGMDIHTPQDILKFLVDTFGLKDAATGDATVRRGLVWLQRLLASRLPYAPPGRPGLDLVLAAFHASAEGEPITDLTQENAVRLLTIHASKGLEFPVVFVVGVEEDLLPFSHPGGSAEETESDRAEREEEEGRLFYVAITRARERLVLTSAAQRRLYGRVVSHRPSRFLARLPADVVTRGSALSALDRAAHRTRQFFKDLFRA